jgi:hypothetical protein
MEIFERMAWYGLFTVSSLYITGAVDNGGLAFTDEDRGVLQGVVIFLVAFYPGNYIPCLPGICSTLI